MIINYEYLELIPKLMQEIKSLKLQTASDKKWLNTRELSEYIGYSLDAINKMVKDEIFVDGIHYYKPSKKLLFNKTEVDNWIVGTRNIRAKNSVNLVVNELVASIK
ncbi:MAG: hypothetical protein WC665_03815 [Sulfurimonas sp.]|jgi:hypothetical protein